MFSENLEKKYITTQENGETNDYKYNKRLSAFNCNYSRHWFLNEQRSYYGHAQVRNLLTLFSHSKNKKIKRRTSQARDCGIHGKFHRCYHAVFLKKKKRSKKLIVTKAKETHYIGLIAFKYMIQDFCFKFYHALSFCKNWRTASFVGRAGMAPLSVTVRAPVALAKSRDSRNRFSS